MEKSDDKILTKIKEIVRKKDPSAKIYLYGSRAKGTEKVSSDWDLLILLNREDITPKLEQEITYSLYDLEFDTEKVISPMLYTEKEWHKKYKVTPFYHNVMTEGKLL